MTTIPPDYRPAPDLLHGRVVLLTGATGGIGAALSRALAAHGATVVLLGRNLRALEQLYDAIEHAGQPRPAICPVNLEGATAKDFDDIAQLLEREFGRLDGLVHTAATLGTLTPLQHYGPGQWERVIRVNLHAPFMLTRACLPLLARSNDASVVITGDSVGRKGKAYWGAYGVSKAALEGLTQILADELENSTIRVNSLDPGPVLTNLRRQAYPAESASGLRTPEQVVGSYLFLLGPDSRGITGQALAAQTAA